MKNLISLSFLSFFLFFTMSTYCQNHWKYPVVPGTKEWTALKSENEIISVQQIPENTLKNMTTEEVYQAWIDLPGRMEILAFNTLQGGFDETRRRFNVLDELLNRKDVGMVVLNKYSMQSPADFNSEWDSKTKGKFITNFAILELFLSQPQVLMNLTSEQKRDLFNKTKLALVKKENFPQKDLNHFWISSGLILGGRILEKESPEFQQKIKSNKAIMDAINRGEIIKETDFELIEKSINENNHYQ